MSESFIVYWWSNFLSAPFTKYMELLIIAFFYPNKTISRDNKRGFDIMAFTKLVLKIVAFLILLSLLVRWWYDCSQCMCLQWEIWFKSYKIFIDFLFMKIKVFIGRKSNLIVSLWASFLLRYLSLLICLVFFVLMLYKFSI